MKPTQFNYKTSLKKTKCHYSVLIQWIQVQFSYMQLYWRL